MDEGFKEFKAWFFSKPLVTRTYLAICVGMTLAITLKLANPMNLFYTFDAAIMNFQIWRIFTPFFYMGKFDFGFLFNMYFAFIALNKVQTLVFTKQKYHDFLWLNVMLFIGCLIFGSIFDLFFFSDTYLMAMIYVWCKRFPHEEITLMFGFKVKTGYFPFVYAIMMMLFGASLLPRIIGIVLGHAYIFAKDIAVVQYRKDYLQTPRWFQNWWYSRSGVQAPRRAAGGFFQGQGVRMQ